MAMNTALKFAIIESRMTQIGLAKRLSAKVPNMNEPRLSKIVNGHIDPTDDEKHWIAKLLKRPIDQLFPGVAA